jgi:hypothetical protein
VTVIIKSNPNQVYEAKQITVTFPEAAGQPYDREGDQYR